MSKNKITELSVIRCPRLLNLNLNDNKIEKLENFDGHPKLTHLYLRRNRIGALQTISAMPSLKELVLVGFF